MPHPAASITLVLVALLVAGLLATLAPRERGHTVTRAIASARDNPDRPTPRRRTTWLLGDLRRAAPFLLGAFALAGLTTLATAAISWNSFFPNQTVKTHSTQFAVDSAGGNHVAYSELDEDGNFSAAIAYGFCLTNCTAEASWTFIAVPHSAGAPDEVSLVVDGTKPRILVRGRKPDPSDPNLLRHPYHYLTCDAACTVAGNWTDSGAVATSDMSDPFVDQHAQSYFALYEGKPRFLYRKAYTFQDPAPPPPVGLYLAFCDANCTNAASWSRQFVTPVDNQLAEYPSLALDATGRPRFLLEQDGADFFSHLFYFECGDATCSTPPVGRELDRTGIPSHWRLRLNAQGQPRVAFRQGDTSDGQGNRLRYVWCTADCAGSGTWDRYVVPGVPQTSQDGLDPDLVLDGEARYLSYHRASPNDGGSPTFAAFLGVCLSGCDTPGGAVWSHQQADTGAAMEAEFPVPAPPGCPNIFWYSGYRSSLALAPDGSPRIGHDAVSLAGKADGTICQETWRAARVSVFGEAGGPAPGPGTATATATATATGTASPGSPTPTRTPTLPAGPSPTATSTSGPGGPSTPQRVYLPFGPVDSRGGR